MSSNPGAPVLLRHREHSVFRWKKFQECLPAYFQKGLISELFHPSFSCRSTCKPLEFEARDRGRHKLLRAPRASLISAENMYNWLTWTHDDIKQLSTFIAYGEFKTSLALIRITERLPGIRLKLAMALGPYRTSDAPRRG